MTLRHFIERRQVGKARRTNLHPVGFVGAVGNHVDTELAFRVFDGRVGFADRQAIAFGKQLEVVDQGFHVLLHFLA